MYGREGGRMREGRGEREGEDGGGGMRDKAGEREGEGEEEGGSDEARGGAEGGGGEERTSTTGNLPTLLTVRALCSPARVTASRWAASTRLDSLEGRISEPSSCWSWRTASNSRLPDCNQRTERQSARFQVID